MTVDVGTEPAIDFRTPEWKAQIAELLSIQKRERNRLLENGNLNPREAAIEAMAAVLTIVAPKIIEASPPPPAALPPPAPGTVEAVRARLAEGEIMAFRERALNLDSQLRNALDKLSKLEARGK